MQNMSKTLRAAAVFIAGTPIWYSGGAWAVTKSSELGVSATITDECFITSSQSLNFGNVEVPIANDNIQVSASITITCDSPPSVGSLTLSGGLNYSTIKNTPDNYRHMKRAGSNAGDPIDYVAYRLSYSPNYNAVLNPGTPHNLTFNSDFDSTYIVYATIFFPQTAKPGNYSDTIVVSFNYEF